MRLSCFDCLNKMVELSGGHCTHFTTKHCLKTYQEQREVNSTDNICYLEYILQTRADLYLLNFPKKMDYRCELNIDRGKHF